MNRRLKVHDGVCRLAFFGAVVCASLVAPGGSSQAEFYGDGIHAETFVECCDYVNPFIGTTDDGHCSPAAAAPFGALQPGPDTGTAEYKYCSGYFHEDEKILGFSQNRLNGTGWMDLGDFLLTPGDRPLAKVVGSECARPGYYAVTLEGGIRCEMAAAAHTAIYRFTYPVGVPVVLKVDCQHGLVYNARQLEEHVLDSEIRRMDSRTICGWNTTTNWVLRTTYMTLVTDLPAESCRDLPTPKAPRYLLRFTPGASRTLQVRIALSTKSVAAAKRNLELEIPDWNLERVKAATAEEWESLLSRVRFPDASPSMLTNLYTSLYHLYLQPNLISDAGEEPRYSTFSLWDTFRAAHPWYTFVVPERVPAFVRSLSEQGERTGYLPIWALAGVENQCMIGTHSIPVIVDAFLKGLCPSDLVRPLYRQVRDSLMRSHPGRDKERWDLLDRYGYYPCDIVRAEGVSRLLECSYDDACAARFAAALGESDDAAFFRARSQDWTNVWDAASGVMRGRRSDGTWRTPFDPTAWGGPWKDGDFTEGNAYQYSWHVLQDIPGLIALMGGRNVALGRLDRLFTERHLDGATGKPPETLGLIGDYAHGNEPSHHLVYVYRHLGRPDAAALRIREIFDRFYRPAPDGLCGNDDCGQMSAWYLFSAMGFYPVDPCGGEYVLGAPQVPRVEIEVERKGGGGQRKVFTVVAKGLSKENKYVRSVTLNGRPLEGFTIRHADILRGGELVFEMTSDPR